MRRLESASAAAAIARSARALDADRYPRHASDLPGQQHAKAVKTGKPLIGGPFKLLDQDGKEFTEANLLGQWSLLYFGFTNCPDICPEELDKMSDVVDVLDKKYGPVARPIFVSCDPARDSVAAVKKYVAGSSPLDARCRLRASL